MNNLRRAELTSVEMAEERYLRHGDQQPSFSNLQLMLDGMRQARLSPKRQLLIAGIHLDVAQHDDIGKSVVDYHLREAEKSTENVAGLDLETLPLDQYRFALKGRLLAAYLPRYRRKLVETVEPNTEDEAVILENLIRIARLTFAPSQITPRNANIREATLAIRGFQFELGMHILNARANLRDGMTYYMWPSLPREDSPHTYDFEVKEGIDARVSSTGLFGPDALRVQFKSVGEVDDYHPQIVTIVGKDDLGTRYSAEIIELACLETYPHQEGDRGRAAERLDEFESRLIAKLENASQNAILQT